MPQSVAALSPTVRARRFNTLLDIRADRIEILVWARALMVPGTKVMLIDADNHSLGRVPLEAAVRSRSAFAIEVRADWLAVDSDNPELHQKLLELGTALRRDGMHPFVLRSGQSGHAHLWVQIAEPALLAEYKQRAKELDFDVREGAKLCRPPMSPHRHGRPLAVLGAQTETQPWRAALEEIGRERRRQEIEATWRRITGDPAWSLPGRTSASPAAPTKPAGTRRRPLGRKWEGLIRYGVPPGQRHQAIQSVTLCAVNAGWTEAQLFAVLINNKLGEKVLEQSGEAAQRQYISLGWKKAVARVAARPSVPGGPQVHAEVARLRAAMEAYPWKPRSGTTDRTVLEAHVGIVASSGRREHDASVRHLAEATGFDWSTVSRAHGRLRKSGWLVPVTGAERRGFATSACWKVTYPRSKDCAVTATHATEAPGGYEMCVALTAHDAFRRHGLGKDTLRVWSHLDAMASVKATALAHTLNRSRRTVYDHLEKLLKYGLAVKGQSGWLRAGAATLDAVAEARGVAGVGAAQKVKHRLDRKTRKDNREMMLRVKEIRTGSKEAEMPAEPVQAVVSR